MPSLKNYIGVGCAVMAAVGLAVAWKEYLQNRELDKKLTQAGYEHSGLQKQVQDLGKRSAQLESEVKSLREASRALVAENGAGGSVSGNAASPDNNLLSKALDSLSRPEVENLRKAQLRSQVDRYYAALFNGLSVTPEQLAKFKDLLVEKQLARFDSVAAANHEGVTDPTELARLVASAQAELSTEIKSTIGDAAYAQYQGFLQTQAQRNVVNLLQQSLAYSKTPLNSAQSDQLVQILAQTGPASGNSNPNSGSSTNANPRAMITGATIAQAQTVLSPPQMQMLQELQKEQQAAQQLRLLLQRQSTGGSAGKLPSK